MKNPRAPRKSAAPPPIAEATILRLYAIAGGVCSFPGCGTYLLDEPLTKKKATLGNVAHIIARKPDGPRGGDPLPMARRSEVDNLMLLCTKCHVFVDKKEFEAEYPAPLLREFKRTHEAHIRAMVGTSFNERTTALRMVGQIRGHLVAVTDAEIRAAVFAHERRHVETIVDVDLRAIPDGADDAYLAIARGKIATELRRRLLPQIEDGSVNRLSVFGLSRIPLLVKLGYGIGDKVPMEIYQRHRVPHDTWTWPAATEPVAFEIEEHRESNGDASRVGILVAVSGAGDVAKVRRATRANVIYVVKPAGSDASRTLLSSPGTLDLFRRTYQALLSRIEQVHPNTTSIDLFIAGPAPIAIICGRDIARDIVPNVVIYDLADGEYVAAGGLTTRTSISLGEC